MVRPVLAVFAGMLILAGCPSDPVLEDTTDTAEPLDIAPQDTATTDGDTPNPGDQGSPDLPSVTDAADTSDVMSVPDTVPDADVPPEAKPFFDPTALAQVTLVFEAEAATQLLADEQSIVTAQVTVDGVVFENASVRLYGPDGSWRSVTEKAGYWVDLDPGGQTSLEGYRSLILDNLQRDGGMVREHVANLLFRALDVPAPKTRYGWLKVNGQDQGLYLLMEPVSDPVFQTTWFDAAGGAVVYGKKDVDLNENGLSKFIWGAGPPNQEALDALVTGLDAVGDEGIYEALDALIDMDRYVTFAAAEIMLGVKRGYVYGPRNYTLIQNPADGRWLILPRELPRTMREGLNPVDGKGRVHKLCLKDLACRKLLGERFQLVYDTIQSLGLANIVEQSTPFILEMAEKDPHMTAPSEDIAASIQATVNYLKSGPAWILANLDCIDPTLVDLDNDGHSGCDADCDDQDPTVYPGAPETCNLKDDDCDGTPDNSDECPACVPYTSTEGGSFTVCLTPRNFEEAEADCVAQGGHLASIRTPEDQDELANFVLDIWWSNWWIGLNDLEEEGNFIWTDGAPISYLAWGSGEPNDSNGEDCGHIWTAQNGLWNDINCDTKMPYICRFEPTEPPDPSDP